MSDARMNTPSKFDIAAYALFTLSALAFIWGYRFLPLQDYPDWLLQGSLFSRLFQGHLPAQYQFIPYPVPNSASTFFLGLFNLGFSPLVSGKIFLTLTVLLFVSGSLYLLNARGNGMKTPLGYVPFLFVLFSKDGRAAARYAAALAPSLLLAAWYAAAHLSSAVPARGEGMPLFDFLLNARAPAGYFSLFRSFYPFTDASDHFARVSGILNLVFLLALGALFLAALLKLYKDRKKEGPLLAVVLLFMAAALFGPRHLAGIASPGERLLYPAAWLLLAFYGPRSWEMEGIHREMGRSITGTDPAVIDKVVLQKYCIVIKRII
ncbi:MAG: hypothetical protein ACYC5N_07940 [Endomicrobiales bacterium]